MSAGMPLTGLSRAGALRAAGVIVITAVVWLAAACSDEDTVDTIPPPWPSATSQSLGNGPQTPTPKPASTTSRHPGGSSPHASTTTSRR